MEDNKNLHECSCGKNHCECGHEHHGHHEHSCSCGCEEEVAKVFLFQDPETKEEIEFVEVMEFFSVKKQKLYVFTVLKEEFDTKIDGDYTEVCILEQSEDGTMDIPDIEIQEEIIEEYNSTLE